MIKGWWDQCEKKTQAIVLILTAIVMTGGLLASIIGGYGLIQFDAEAAEWRENHVLTEAEKFKNDRIDRLERENQRIRRQLANPNMAEWDRSQAKEDKKENDAKIKCIQDDKC